MDELGSDEGDSRDTLLSLQTTSKEATGAGATTIVFGTGGHNSYDSVNVIGQSVAEGHVHPQEDTRGIPVQAQSIDDDNHTVFVSNRCLETIVAPRSSINSDYRDDSPFISTNPGKDYTTLKRLRPQCGCRATCVSLTIAFILATFSSVFAVTLTLPKSRQRTVTVLPGDTVLMDPVSPFWFDRVTISENAYYKRDSSQQLKFYTTACRDLVTNEKDRYQTTPILYTPDIYVMVPPMNYIDESTIHFNLTIVNSTSPDVTILVGLSKSENWSTYSAFQGGEPLINGSNVILRTISLRDKGDSPSWTIIDFTIPITGYYFVGMSILPQGTLVYFNYNYHIHHFFYSQSDYSTPVCTINTPGSDTCSLEISKDITNSEAQPTCVLVYMYVEQGDFDEETHVEVEYTMNRITWNIYSLSFGVLFAIVLAIIFVVMVIYVTYCSCRRQRYYSYEKL